MFQSKLKIAVSSVLCGSFFLFSPVSNAAQNDGLVAHWSFDDCTAKDVSGNGHDGTINGNPVCVNGKKGKAFSFDGIDDFIELADEPAFNSEQFSISAWASAKSISSSIGGAPILFNKENQYEVGIMSDSGKVGFAIHTTAKDWVWDIGDFIPNMEVPFFTTLTFDGNKGTLYVNGKKYKEIVYGAGIRVETSCFRIAKRGCWDGQVLSDLFNGVIDEVSYYNRALSETEIKELYSGSQGISGNINGVQKFNAICKNLKTQQTKKIAVTDGAKPWDCTAAGLKAKKGEQINVSITGVAK